MMSEASAEYTAVTECMNQIERELKLELELHQRVVLEALLYEFGRRFPYDVVGGWRYW